MKISKFFVVVLSVLVVVSLFVVADIVFLYTTFIQNPDFNDAYYVSDEPGALYVYGCFYLHGQELFVQDKAKGLRWIRRSAEQNFDLAQATMAYLYFKGDGVPQDKAEARKWAEKAEKNGFPVWDNWAQWEQEEAEIENETENENQE